MPTNTAQPPTQAQRLSEWQDFKRLVDEGFISNHATQDKTRERAELERDLSVQLDKRVMNINGKQVSLSPGMNVTAQIKTGERRVIKYLLSPIQRAGSESLRKR